MDLQFNQKIIDNLGVPQLVDIRDQLPRHKNGSWADIAGFRKFSDLDVIGLHHDAIGKHLRADWEPLDIIKNIANTHINTKQYTEGGLPYHIVIIRGVAYYCNEISWKVYGISNHNNHVIHVMVHGNYVQFDTLTDADRRCLIAVCLMLMEQKELMPNLTMIKAHKELSPTSCPGYDYASIRNDVETWQQKFAREDSWDWKIQQINGFLNQVQYMTDLIKEGSESGRANWALNSLMDAIDVMRSKNLL